ncbi:hypothetical protein [Pseudomonas syringae]|uniref:hypothetical protein n=1 Tax=Pseudomonas syringae TaxID=317 RepID=UPI000CDA321F|nr:hypothetical protein [Pseudomonas syringae]MBI6794979.1 hypothetical protein [Pseudomonas syringae]POR65201.1 hypothetical protein BKM27_26210 [Pseudomonas syringae pv. syringae]
MAKQKGNPKTSKPLNRDIDIKLFLTGTQPVPDQQLADFYEVTVARNDGVACTETELFYVLMKCYQSTLKNSNVSVKKH